MANFIGFAAFTLAFFITPLPAAAPMRVPTECRNDYAMSEKLGCREVLGTCLSHKAMAKVKAK